MELGFWKKLKKPIFALAPMANVTDAAFRHIIAKYGKPDVMWTEFVSCDGLCSEGKEALLPDLQFDESERPIVAQFFGATPAHFYECAQLAVKLGFDGIDINMGCPDKNVMKQKAGAALIDTPELAGEIIAATKRGAGTLPVSVKTRIGTKRDTLVTWLPFLLEQDLATITIHARTAKELSLVPAHWEIFRDAVRMRNDIQNNFKTKTLLLGNGDVEDIENAAKKAEEYGLDGVMIGRGIFGNPWCFRNTNAFRNNSVLQRGIVNLFRKTSERGRGKDISVDEKLRVMVEHTFLFENLFSGMKSFDVMKKHYKAYVNGFDGAKELRIKLMNAKCAQEVADIVADRS